MIAEIRKWQRLWRVRIGYGVLHVPSRRGAVSASELRFVKVDGLEVRLPHVAI